MNLYETYDGAFFAISCLRSAIREYERELKEHDKYEKEYGEKVFRRFNEVVFYIDEFYRRREKAREYRKDKEAQ